MKSFMPIRNDTAYEGTLVYSGVWFQVYIQDCRLTENRYLLISSTSHIFPDSSKFTRTTNPNHQEQLAPKKNEATGRIFDEASL